MAAELYEQDYTDLCNRLFRMIHVPEAYKRESPHNGPVTALSIDGEVVGRSFYMFHVHIYGDGSYNVQVCGKESKTVFFWFVWDEDVKAFRGPFRNAFP